MGLNPGAGGWPRLVSLERSSSMLGLPQPTVHRLAVARAGGRPAWRRRRWPAIALLVALLLPAAATVAQAGGLLFLVLDINTASLHTGSAFAETAPPADPRTAQPSIAVLGSELFFAATDGTHGQ